MIPANPLAWRARKVAARRVLDDHSLVRARIRTLVQRVDERLRLAAIEAAAERADELAKIERERVESLRDEVNDVAVEEHIAMVRR